MQSSAWGHAVQSARVFLLGGALSSLHPRALPGWERAVFAEQRARLIEYDCMIPHHARAAANRAPLGKYAVLPNGAPFTHVVADALHTIVSIAKGKFDDVENAKLETVDIAALTPLAMIAQSYFPRNTFYSNPFFAYPTTDGILKDGTEKRPLVLKVMEDGVNTERTFPHGLGLGTHSRVSFALPAKTSDRFECRVGLHASLGTEGSVAFRIYADGEAVFDSGIMTSADASRKVTLPIWRVRELSLDVEARGTSARGKNSAVIAEPTLLKAKSPPKLDIPGVQSSARVPPIPRAGRYVNFLAPARRRAVRG